MIAAFGLLAGLFTASVGVPQGPVAGGRVLFALDATTLLDGGLPATARLLSGGLSVSTRDGVRMLRAATPTEFLLTLPEVLPQDFTLEFDIVPKQCCNPEDLAVEGTATISRSSSSAHILWHRNYQSVMGGGPAYQAVTPADLQETTPGQLTNILISVEGETVKLYTNGRRLYTLTERRFARGRVLRVFLGGQDDGDQAVYLARLRVTAGAATVVAQQQSGQRSTTITETTSGSSGGGGGVRTAGGTAATPATTTTTTAAVAPRTSAGATATGPVTTATSTTQQPPAGGTTTLTAVPVAPPAATGMLSPSQPPPPPAPPPPPPAPAPPAPSPAPAPPPPMPAIGMGEASTAEGQPELEPEAAPEPPQDPIAPSVMVIDGVAFPIMLRKGGSAVAQVVEVVLSDGTVKKHLATTSVEPMVVDVAPGTQLDVWLQAQLSGGSTSKTGYITGGNVPAGQKLDFLNGMLTAVTLPALVASSTAAGYLRYTIVPEEVRLSPLGPAPAVTARSWKLSDFRLMMADLETQGTLRLEPISAEWALTQDNLGTQRIATTTLGRQAISNIRLTIPGTAPDGTPSGQKFLAWYDDFVVKGNNGDDKELSFTLELGLGLKPEVSGMTRSYTAGSLFKMQGSGVGIIAIRAVPQPVGSTVRQLQIDLYVEKLALVP